MVSIGLDFYWSSILQAALIIEDEKKMLELHELTPLT